MMAQREVINGYRPTIQKRAKKKGVCGAKSKKRMKNSGSGDCETASCR
jgi:hypothetical protein